MMSAGVPNSFQMKKLSLLFLSLLAMPMVTRAQTPVYLDDTKPVEQRIEDALSRMTLREKINVIHAQSKFSSAGVKRLGFRRSAWCPS